MAEIYKISESKLDQLKRRYNLADYKPYGLLKTKLDVLRNKKSSLLLTIDKQKKELELARKEHAQLQAEALFDTTKEKALAASSKNMGRLREELNDSESLLDVIDGSINDLLPEYEATKEEAIHQLNLRAKKDHLVLARKFYSALKELSKLQLEEREFEISIVSATGKMKGHVISKLANDFFILPLGDEEVCDTPFYHWLKIVNDNGYNL